MKRYKIKSLEKISFTFARISTWTGYLIALLAVFLFVVENDPEVVNLVPVAQLFFEAAKITVELEKNTEKSNKFSNPNHN
ncbi:MAG: hypothetical protein AAF630_05880 [Cyanobacteria bacterium P01_C01_bin.38]